jgi:cysteinyl-tRNA synthetase
VVQEFTLDRGAQFRLVALMTHYRSPMDFSKQRMEETARILERWVKACIPTPAGPPCEVLEALCDDLNTPKAIAAMHVYRKTDGKKLFAAMRFLGLFNEGRCLPDDWRTLPDDQLQGMSFGPDAVAEA